MGSCFILFLPDRIRSWMRPPKLCRPCLCQHGIQMSNFPSESDGSNRFSSINAIANEYPQPIAWRVSPISQMIPEQPHGIRGLATATAADAAPVVPIRTLRRGPPALGAVFVHRLPSGDSTVALFNSAMKFPSRDAKSICCSTGRSLLSSPVREVWTATTRCCVRPPRITVT